MISDDTSLSQPSIKINRMDVRGFKLLTLDLNRQFIFIQRRLGIDTLAADRSNNSGLFYLPPPLCN